MTDAQQPTPPTTEQIQQVMAQMLSQQQTANAALPTPPVAAPVSAAVLPAMAMQAAPPMQPQMQMMPAGQMMAAPTPQAVLFNLSIPLPDGSEIRAYLSFPGTAAQNLQALQMLAQQVAMTWPVNTYQPRNRGWNSNGGGNWNNNGGGYRSRRYRGGY